MIRVYVVYRLLIREALEFLGAVSKLFEFSDFPMSHTIFERTAV